VNLETNNITYILSNKHITHLHNRPPTTNPNELAYNMAHCINNSQQCSSSNNIHFWISVLCYDIYINGFTDTEHKTRMEKDHLCQSYSGVKFWCQIQVKANLKVQHADPSSPIKFPVKQTSLLSQKLIMFIPTAWANRAVYTVNIN